MKNTIDNIEEANFVILSLIRKLYVLCQKSSAEDAEIYRKKIHQLQKDLKHLDNPQVFSKVQNTYIPYLQQLTETENE